MIFNHWYSSKSSVKLFFPFLFLNTHVPGPTQGDFDSDFGKEHVCKSRGLQSPAIIQIYLELRLNKTIYSFKND